MSTVTEISKVHVGCGPKALLPGWWNTDLRPFDGIDEALDATQPWPWDGLTHVYAEHFIEHLEIDQAFAFLTHAGNSLAPGGRIRLSTPNLAWVMLTHFAQQPADFEQRLSDTLKTNRAFHGWGHRFLWSEEMLVALLTTMGYENVETFAYGESNDPELRGIERHGGYSVVEGQPSVIIVEAVRGAAPIGVPEGIAGWVDHEFLRHVRAGH
jgi:predicted SAM-dependent methyltransferase